MQKGEGNLKIPSSFSFTKLPITTTFHYEQKKTEIVHRTSHMKDTKFKQR